jgi:hypoxanthine phosphoribosyltransferase
MSSQRTDQAVQASDGTGDRGPVPIGTELVGNEPVGTELVGGELVGGEVVSDRGTGRAPLSGLQQVPELAEVPDLGEEVVGEEQIQARIKDLGAQITADYADRPPLLVGVLKGAFVFMSDLARAIELPVEFDFMAVASYGSSTRTSGVVRIVKDLDTDLTGRHVLLVEDIVDSGLTLAFLMRNLAARHPASLEVCALLVKDVEPDVPQLAYVGFRIPRDFVVGYGLDIGERYRNLRSVRRYNGPVSQP